MKHIEQVIILGAGASKSDGMPMQNELFKVFFKKRSIFEEMKKDHPKLIHLLEGQEILIKKFFDDFWGIDIKNFGNKEDFPTFEECLGMLDLANLQRQCFKDYDQEMITKIRNSLIFLISKLLDEKNRNLKLNHEKLINRLKDENMLKKTAYISLNYDILIDNALMSCHEFNIDYGIEFVNFKRPQDKDKTVLLLKPHGSLNWLYCPTCNHIKIFHKENRLIYLFLDIDHEYVAEKISCEECGTKMKDVIVPMTYFKEMSNPFIQHIFSEADEVLRHASKIIICGYSFPDADIHIKYLLKRAEKFNEKTPEIFIINNHPKKTKRQKKDEEQRFTRFFKNKDKIHYTDKSFEDFVKEGV